MLNGAASMAGSLDSIVALQATLRELAEARERLGGIPEWMQELHEEHSGRRAEIDTVEEAAEEATRERRAAEAQLQDAQEKLKHYQQQIGMVSTQREYGALLKEIDTVKTQISDLEQEALEALERYEQAQEQLTQLEDDFRDLDERYQTELKKWEDEKPEVARRAEELEGRAAALREKVSDGYLQLFDRLYERYDGAAVARVLRVDIGRGPTMAHCVECHYRIRPQVVVQIREQGLIAQCDNCKRILFYQEEP